MKTSNWQTILATVAVAGLTASASTVWAQNATSTAPVTVSAPAPQLSYGVQQVMQLEQAKISDDVVIAYIKSSPNSYGLTADQIIYLRQQGMASPVIAAMLNQGAPMMAASAPAPAPVPQPAPAAVTPASPAPAVAPSVTYVQPAPATTVYYTQPYYYPAYYYPYDYGWYPPVSLSFGWGWGGGWHGGGGWRGGGGWHGGGGHR